MTAKKPDELAVRRTRSGTGPIAHSPVTRPRTAHADEADADASAPEPLDLRADDRDVAADSKDLAASERDTHVIDVGDADQVALERLLAARDRAAAALDRKEAALDRHRASDYLKRAYRDNLTGALQRDAGRDQLEREVERARRTQGPLAIAFVDVVGLKRTNDELGHAAGDHLLQAVGTALRTGLRAYDLVVRWGGDEFVCALPNSSLTDASHRFIQVQTQLGMTHPGAEVSLGFTEIRPEDLLQDAINRADHDLYEHRAHDAAGPRSR